MKAIKIEKFGGPEVLELKDIEIGIISAINSISINEIEVVITLKTNPLEENFFGMIGRKADEI